MPVNAPHGNVVLQSLLPADHDALAPHLAEVAVHKGQILIQQFDEVEVVHFPVSAYLSNSLLFEDGQVVETTAVGRDGLSGLAAFLAETPIGWAVICQLPGVVLQMDADVLRRRAEVSPPLRNLLLRVTHENQSQAAQTVACNALHDITQRLARWLLSVSDRTGRRVLEVTQEGIAAQFGAQRTTINASAQTLRKAGAIAFRRGRLEIVDRAALEQAACECYRAQADRADAYGLRLTAP